MRRGKNRAMITGIPRIKVIDLFCGIGGLTHGLVKEGLDVIAGIDNDNSCKYGFEYNNNSRFIHKDILQVSADEIERLFGDDTSTIRVLTGCAPCQPFSNYNAKRITKKQLQPLEKFAQLIDQTKPDIVSMENVRGLADKEKYPIFKTFIDILKKNGYKYSYKIVDVSEYGVPQKRKRLVLLASLFGEIELIKKTHRYKKRTVRNVIEDLAPLKDGEVSSRDPMHRARKLDPTNLQRIKSTPHDGGSSNSWDKSLVLRCHKKKTGKTYKGTVYGRMRWDEPAPTMTTHCVGIGNGRFGHPKQDRAISLREAAIFQTFPKYYRFIDPKTPIYTGHIAKFIGNAVPVRLGAIIAKSIKVHVRCYANKENLYI